MKEALKERFFSKIADFAQEDKLDPYPMQRIADWWLTELDKALEVREQEIVRDLYQIAKTMEFGADYHNEAVQDEIEKYAKTNSILIKESNNNTKE